LEKLQKERLLPKIVFDIMYHNKLKDIEARLG